MTVTDATTTAPDLTDNPLMQRSGLSAFDRIAPEHVVPGVTASLAEIAERFDAIEASAAPTWDGLMKPLEDLSRVYEYCWGPVAHLKSVRDSAPLREAFTTMQPKVVQLGLRMSQSRAVYDALVALREGEAWSSLSLSKQRIVESKIKDMNLSGVGLDGEAKARFLEISERLSSLATDFANQVLDATKAFELIVKDKADTEGWTSTLRAMASDSYNQARQPDTQATAESGPWRITLDGPSFSAFMQHSRNRSQRETVYRAFVSRASSGELNNAPLIDEILKLRKEKALLLGFKNHGEVSLSTKMAGEVSAVQAMFDELTAASKPGMERDLDELRAFAKEQGETNELMHWDFAFWAERMREQRFAYTDEELRPYFPLPRVLDGMFGVCTKLFGVRFERDDEAAPAWHDDVQVYRVLDEDGSMLAMFYLDPYSRPADKRGGAWVNTCLSRRVVGGEVVHPVVYVICNGTNPTKDRPSLMSFDEVITLFHEFGHALQAMLTEVDEADAAGLGNIEWDAVEICSQFMENWCYHKPTLLGMTRHIDTGEPLPDDLFDKLVRARTYRAGTMFMRQMYFGVTDMTLHTSYDPDGEESVEQVYRRVAQTYAPLPPLDDDHFLCSFAHIFAGGYSAGYYSYKWSELLSADCFGAFEEAGLDNEAEVTQIGRRFRETFLARGGAEHPMAVFQAFRGRKPSSAALIRHNGLADSAG